MSVRPVPFVVVLLASAFAWAAAAVAQTPPARGGAAAPAAPPGAAPATPIEFYLAHSDADACGPGCHEWIAAEGKFDAAAADRFRQLLKTLKDRRPPIYLHSPGGNINGALLLGRLIRDKKFEVSVGRTVPLDCSNDKKSDNSCEAQKHAGKPIEAEISQTVAQCNSACVYALAGGAVHNVPPWVGLGIHDAGLDPNAPTPNGIALQLGLRLVHTRLRSYLRSMGIDDALYSATLATPNESVKVIKRDDFVRFGIDRREFGETSWQFVDDKPPLRVRKLFFARTDGDEHSVDGAVEVECVGQFGTYLKLARTPLGPDADAATAGPATTSIAVAGKQVGLSRLTVPNFYVRSGRVTPAILDAVGDGATIDVPGAEMGRKERGDVMLSMDGFAAAYAKLRQRCPGATAAVRTVAVLPPGQGKLSDPQAAATPAQPPQKVGGVSDPRTVAWLTQLSKSKGAPPGTRAAAQNSAAPLAAGKSQTPQALELTRVATGEQKLRVDFLSDVRPDCSSAGPLTVGVLEQPQHGALTTENGEAFTDFAKDDQRAPCNTHKSTGTLVFYQPGADYHGTDSVTLTVALPFGGTARRHYSIEVK